jgi:cobalt/nickel transport system ATP-binding protein
MKKIIEILNLNFAYPDGFQALNGINLDIYEGESLGIIGANGAGKSTLLLHLNGLLNGRGKVKIFDRIISKESLPFVREKIGFVFQDPQDQLFMPTAYEDVAFGPQNLGLSREEVDKRVMAALAEVGLSEKKNRLSYHLSIGEQKRLALATVLSMHPEILILDEPNSNLDPASRRHLINLLANLAVTKVIATHDLEMVLDLCSRVIILDKGRIVSEGQPQQILSNQPLLESSSLELPLSIKLKSYAQNLIRTL